MADPPRIRVDFNKTGGGRLELTTRGTRTDLDRSGVELSEGLLLSFFDDDTLEDESKVELVAEGRVFFDVDRDCWAAVCDRASFRWERHTDAGIERIPHPWSEG